MDQMNAAQLQKILDEKRKSQVSAPKLTIAEMEQLIADRKLISEAIGEFEKLRNIIEAQTHRPLTDEDIRAYYDSLAFQQRFQENEKNQKSAEPQKSTDADFLELKSAFEPTKKTDADFSTLKDAFATEDKNYVKDADFSALEAAFQEDDK